MSCGLVERADAARVCSRVCRIRAVEVPNSASELRRCRPRACGAVVARVAYNDKVTGSSPVTPTVTPNTNRIGGSGLVWRLPTCLWPGTMRSRLCACSRFVCRGVTSAVRSDTNPLTGSVIDSGGLWAVLLSCLAGGALPLTDHGKQYRGQGAGGLFRLLIRHRDERRRGHLDLAPGSIALESLR
jgi:hypothetical protein